MTKKKAGMAVLAIITILVVGIFIAVGYSYLNQPSSGRGDDEVEINTGKTYDVSIVCPSGEPLVDSGKLDHHGKPIMVRCNTCHDTKEPNRTTGSVGELDEFHQNLKFKHGSLKCASCHDPNNYEALRLADGRSLPFSKSMQLCAQCHGPQYRDYKNGSHGGMSGYWDLTRGPRTRNSCTSCHDAHAPAYPKVMPVFPPKKREGAQKTTNH